MKKIILFFISVCLILSVFGITCFAEGEDVDTPMLDESQSITESSVTDDEPSVNVFTRIYEFWEAHEAEIITIGSSAVLIVLNILSRISGKTLNRSQNDTIGGLNQLIEEFNKLSVSITNIKSDFSEVIKNSKEINAQLIKVMRDVLSAMSDLKTSDEAFTEKITKANVIIQELVEKEMLQNNALMEVLSSVYVNSKALSQGVKDLVVMKRTENMRIVEEANEIAHPHHNNVDGGKNDV